MTYHSVACCYSLDQEQHLQHLKLASRCIDIIVPLKYYIDIRFKNGFDLKIK